MLLEVNNVRYSYEALGRKTEVLRGVSFTVGKGELVGVLGRSGAGKSTLFYLLGGMLSPDSGNLRLAGTDLADLPPDELARLRSRRIGFVFQQFHLLPRASVLENILLPLRYPSETAELTEADRARAVALATRLGLADRLDHFPNQLSGGEQQRVAIARALVIEPDIVLADEPTGNLDSKNATAILALLESLRQEGRTILLITHDAEVAKACSRTITLVDGRVESGGESTTKAVPSRKSEGVPEAPSLLSRLLLVRAVLPLALSSLGRNKTRSALTMAGVAIGIAALFSMITFGTFARDQILAGFEELGSNTVRLSGWPGDRRKANDKVDVLFDAFDVEKDMRPLRRIFPEIQFMSPLMAGWGNTVNYGGRAVQNDTQTFGIDVEFGHISRRGLVAGKFFSPVHIEQRSPVCLIGTEIVDRLFRGPGAARPPRDLASTDTTAAEQNFFQANVLGRIVFLTKQDGAGFPCRVVGVLGPQSSNMDWRKPNFDVILPYTYFKAVTADWEARIHSFVVQTRSDSDVERVGRGLRTFFEQKYGAGGEFALDSNMVLVAQMRKSVTLFTLLLSSIALITLLVGGMGINNMMLVSLAERFKEIGLCKALGATDRSVRAQFLCESTVLAGIAGVAGLVSGFAAYQTILYFASKVVSKLSFQWVVDWKALAFSAASVIAVGIVSGMVPALKAERLTVIQALRSE